MRLRNKKTGEIMDDAQYRNYSLSDGFGFRMNGKKWEYHSLAELNEEWEDVAEPEKYWYITGEGDICRDDIKHSEWIEERKSIGNYFETEEEAEKAVEKLKAWKRLKDKGFRFTDYDYTTYKGKGCGQVFFNDVSGKYLINEIKDDLDLLFGGEE